MLGFFFEKCGELSLNYLCYPFLSRALLYGYVEAELGIALALTQSCGWLCRAQVFKANNFVFSDRVYAKALFLL